MSIAIATTALGLGTEFALTHHSTVLRPAIPLAIASWALFTIHHGYFAIRQIRWWRRRRLESARLTALAIPDDVPRPATFDGVGVIDAAQRDLLPTSPDHQGDMFARGIKVAILPTLAVFIAATQNVINPDTRLAVGLSVAEFAAMFAIVVLVWRSRNPSDRWVAARTRTELLRREQYLRLAGVGPYLGLDRAEADVATDRRIDLIRTGTDAQVRELIAMRTDGRWWIDQFWTRPAAELTDTAGRVRSYRYYRIQKQIMWFDLASGSGHRAERRIAAAIKTSLVTAMIVIAATAALQAYATPDAAKISAAANILTLILPPICAFLLALQEMYSYRRLAISYREMLDELRAARVVLDDLIRTIEDGSTSIDVAGRQFQAAALHTEDALTIELQRWAVLIQRDEFDMSL